MGLDILGEWERLKQFLCTTGKIADQGLLGSIEGPAEFEDLMLILLLVVWLCFFPNCIE